VNKLIRHYWPEFLITVAVWVLVGWQLGLDAFLITLILSILEITLSADNAVVNSRVLMRLSMFWQRMFLTVGIIFAVFIVRFVLPIIMVSIATSLDVGSVFSLAINDPEAYGHKLHEVAPLINGFGGFFLLMVALFFFVDKTRHPNAWWLRIAENLAVKLAHVPLAKTVVIALVYGLIWWLLPADSRPSVGAAMAFGIGLYVLLEGMTRVMEHFSDGASKTKQVVGWGAFILFMYLQVLDASFSLDGVVGAFVLTNNIIIIMAGLGIGALWVRTMTIYMVQHGTLQTYRYLESGAHWAIVALATIMILKLYHIELPELVVGTIGLVFVASAVYSSVKMNRQQKKLLTK
jgi:hypothetical protein